MDARHDEGGRLLAATEFAQALAVAAHTNDVAEAVRTYLAASFGASFANLALVEAGSESVHVLHPADLDHEIADRYTNLSLRASTPLTDAIRSGFPVVVPDRATNAERYPDLVSDTIAAGLNAIVAIPLRWDGEISGAIGLGWPRPLDLTEPFLARLRSVADLTAGAVARTRTSDTHARFIAEVQAQMQPTATPEATLDVAGLYQPSGVELGFGGDWYDVIRLGDHRTAIVVGDVVGHGIEAAAKMVVVRSAIKAVVQLEQPVEDIFPLTAPLIEGARRSFIATAVVLVIDTAEQRIDYTSAGHPPAIVVRPDGGTDLLDGGAGIVLGWPDPAPHGSSVPFPPGALLVAYTDGLVEARSAVIDAGIRRLGAAATASSRDDAGADLIAARMVTSMGGLDHLADDVALVVVRHRTASLPPDQATALQR